MNFGQEATVILSKVLSRLENIYSMTVYRYIDLGG